MLVIQATQKMETRGLIFEVTPAKSQGDPKFQQTGQAWCHMSNLSYSRGRRGSKPEASQDKVITRTYLKNKLKKAKGLGRGSSGRAVA
jgi:hypothetical protein